ncbi:hypothetical protein [Natronoglycomyces albus]|uniref:Uncharacterized protein n=1 Tax=Natronoglycomyces albus TaxID=2811108 RepID=A0A895XQY0_9ACTN|nr:hypothetical protein [Natronoglycomyces albus]QSB04966.1 hypothetical protein JQS30_14560 [Natronoglycomyces albus]
MSTPDPVIIAHDGDKPKPDAPEDRAQSVHEEQQPSQTISLTGGRHE